MYRCFGVLLGARGWCTANSVVAGAGLGWGSRRVEQRTAHTVARSLMVPSTCPRSPPGSASPSSPTPRSWTDRRRPAVPVFEERYGQSEMDMQSATAAFPAIGARARGGGIRVGHIGGSRGVHSALVRSPVGHDPNRADGGTTRRDTVQRVARLVPAANRCLVAKLQPLVAAHPVFADHGTTPSKRRREWCWHASNVKARQPQEKGPHMGHCETVHKQSAHTLVIHKAGFRMRRPTGVPLERPLQAAEVGES